MVSPEADVSPAPRAKTPVAKSPLANTRRSAHAWQVVCPCDRCRVRHQKCHIRWDRKACASCEKAKAECKRTSSGLQIRFSKFAPIVSNSEADQESSSSNPSLPARGREEDGSIASTTDAYQPDVADSDQLAPPAWSASQNAHGPHVERDIGDSEGKADHCELQYGGQAVSELSLSEGDGLIPGLHNASPWPVTSPTMMEHDQPATFETDGRESTSPVSSSVQPTGYGLPNGQPEKQCLWPLSQGEMQLVKYFFKFLVSWFDYCDPRMHFRAYIGSHIATDAAILYAVLAVSARHREITMAMDDHQSNKYEHLCLEQLIPSLSDTSKVLQDTVFASALLLRLLEEMTQRSDQPTMEAHQVSTPILMQIKQKNTQSTEFSDAAMIVALRQEIFVANMTQRAVEPVADYCNIDMSLTQASDAVWTHRIIAHTAAVTTFVYNNTANGPQEWERLLQYAIDWDRLKPESFRPMYTSLSPAEGINSDWTDQSSSGTLPTISYTSDCATAAQQYLQLCKILLLAHDRRNLGLGLGRAKRNEGYEEQIRQAVRIICGVSNSNSEYVPAQLTAGLAIAMCGELFVGAHETLELFQILSQAEMHLGWPCLKVSEKLRAFWNLPSGGRC